MFFSPLVAFPLLGMGVFFSTIYLTSWMQYEWFRLWYYQQAYASAPSATGAAPYYEPAAVNATVEGATPTGALPELGYADRANWTPQQINDQLVYLEQANPSVVDAGYRVIYDPLSSQYKWVANANYATLPASTANHPRLPGVQQ